MLGEPEYSDALISGRILHDLIHVVYPPFGGRDAKKSGWPLEVAGHPA
jgi:hypothetical protein